MSWVEICIYRPCREKKNSLFDLISLYYPIAMTIVRLRDKRWLWCYTNVFCYIVSPNNTNTSPWYIVYIYGRGSTSKWYNLLMVFQRHFGSKQGIVPQLSCPVSRQENDALRRPCGKSCECLEASWRIPLGMPGGMWRSERVNAACFGLISHVFCIKLPICFDLPQVILKMTSNAIAWNPMEAFTFTVANEDYKYARLLNSSYT